MEFYMVNGCIACSLLVLDVTKIFFSVGVRGREGVRGRVGVDIYF